MRVWGSMRCGQTCQTSMVNLGETCGAAWESLNFPQKTRGTRPNIPWPLGEASDFGSCMARSKDTQTNSG